MSYLKEQKVPTHDKPRDSEGVPNGNYLKTQPVAERFEKVSAKAPDPKKAPKPAAAATNVDTAEPTSVSSAKPVSE